MYSIYDLAYIYKEKYNLTANKAMNIIIWAVKNNANINDIIDYSKSNNVFVEKSFYSSDGVKKSGNYIKPDKFYYHNLLKLTSKPSEIEFDMVTGEFKTTFEEEAFIEIKASISEEDIYEYVKSKEYLNKSTSNKAKFMGALKILLIRHDVDLLLFMIDTCELMNEMNQKNTYSIFEIENYIELATENYNRCKNDYIILNNSITNNPLHESREILKKDRKVKAYV